MPRIPFASFVLVSLIIGATAVTLAGPTLFNRLGTREAVKWHDNLPAAHRQAAAENKPILIVFGAEWCGFCTKLEKQTLQSPEVSRSINEGFVPVHLDFDKEKRISELLKVTSLPCVVVVSPQADLLGRIEGFQGPVPFQQKLQEARELYHSIQPVSSSGTILR